MSLLPPPPTGITPDSRPLREDDDPIHDPDQHTLPDLVMARALTFDSAGRLWGAGLGGLIRWLISPSKVTYKVWHPEHGASGADGISIFSHAGKVYMGHESGWISVFDPEGGDWTRINTANEEESAFPVRSFGLSAEGAVLACTDGGVYALSQGKHIPFPESALCAACAFDLTWIGAEGGLWNAESGSTWEWVDLGFPFYGVTVLQVISGSLWAGGSSGAARLTDKGAFKLPLEGAVRGIVPSGDQVYILTDTGLWIGDIQGENWTHTPGRARLLAASPTVWVIGESDAIDVTFHNPGIQPRPLLPPLEDVPHEAWRTFQVGHELWLQSNNGVIWQRLGKTWRRYEHPSGTALSGVITLGGQSLLGFESVRGIGIIQDGAITYPAEAKAVNYVTRLILEGNTAAAETLSGMWQSSNGVEWVKQGN